MKIDISFTNLYLHKQMFDYFFREQSNKTVNELISRSGDDILLVLDAVDRYDNDYNVEDIEKMFYEDSVEEIAKKIGIELEEE